MNDRRFDGEIERLRAPERLARLELKRVISICLEGLHVQQALDVGTGSGLFAGALADHGIQVAGVDVNPAMIPVAQQFVPKGAFQVAPAEALPFPDCSFDLVFLGLVLHETDNALAALQQAQRVARWRVGILEWPYEAGEFGPPLAHRLKAEDIEAMAKQAGFTNIQRIRLTYLVLYRLDLPSKPQSSSTAPISRGISKGGS